MRTRRPRPTLATRSAFAGFRFPPDVIVLAVRWYLRFGLSYRDGEELLAERGVEVDHVTVYRCWPTPLGRAGTPSVTAGRSTRPTSKWPGSGATSIARSTSEELPFAWHRTGRYANNRVEADHGRLKAWLRPMRGLKQDRNARVIIAGHALVENVRRGHYELAVEEPVGRRMAVAFDELALAV
jgi:transposase, IS6 family